MSVCAPSLLFDLVGGYGIIMAKGGGRKASGKQSEEDRTVAKLRDLMREAYRRKGKPFHTHEYPLRRVVEVCGHILESEFTKRDLDDYPKRRLAAAKANGKKISRRSIRKEEGMLRRLFRFESDLNYFSISQAAKEAKLTYAILHGLEKDGCFAPSVQPKVICVRGPRTGRWNDDDIKALKRYRALQATGCSQKRLMEAGANLRSRRPWLATNGEANNAVFANTNLKLFNGDICEEANGKRISWNRRPGHEICLDSGFLRATLKWFSCRRCDVSAPSTLRYTCKGPNSGSRPPPWSSWDIFLCRSRLRAST